MSGAKAIISPDRAIAEVETSSLSNISLIGNLPITEKLSLTGTVGQSRLKGSLNNRQTGGRLGNFTEKSNSFGIGISYRLTESKETRLMLDQKFNNEGITIQTISWTMGLLYF